MMFWMKVFDTKFDTVVTLCDEHLIDKVLDKKGIKFKVSKHFYGEKLVDEDTALNFMKKATIGNLIGNEAIELAVKNGFVSKENVVVIDDIPHAQWAKL
ncbi:MAG: DUF424 family protein [Candidatus Aenigmatarchaeota archaeon]